MKLVQINHRGREFRVVATTLLWAPDTLTMEQFRADLRSARDSYQAAQAAALVFAGPRPTAGARTDGWVTAGPNHPDSTTLGELREQARAAQAAYVAWNAQREAAMRPFGSFMVELGYHLFGDPDPALAGDVLWGRHWDSTILAEQTPDPGRDLPGSLRQREIQVPVPEAEAIWEGAYTLETEEYVTADPTEDSTPVASPDSED
jgi:hypothetical protein